MIGSRNNRTLGIGAIIVALFLVFFAIPTFVSSPSNVPNVILSPLFWPYALAGFTGLAGVGLLLARDTDDAPEPSPEGGWTRLLGLAALMGLTVFAMPIIGLVWTAMAVFAATAFLVHTRHRKVALISAVIVPLVLYVFFAHVAGVAVPQGEFVRLP